MTSEPTLGSKPDPDEQWQTLARYLAGESSATEIAQVDRWLAEDPRRAELLDALESATARLERPVQDDIDVEAALQRVAARLDESTVQPIRSPARRAGWTGGLMRAAALVALLLGAAVVVWRATRPDATSPVPVLAERTYSAPIGAIDSVRLADGTRVLLAPGSRLTVDVAYGRATYEVQLAGEALFDVAAAAAGRFTVRAGQAVIRDLGTTFSVRSDAAEIRVVVTTGSVVLSVAAAADSGTVLRAGDRGVLSRGGQVSTERGAASRDDLAWTDGRLVFRNATLAQVADELRRWYGIQLEFADSSLAARQLTASFDGEDAQQVLAVLALALDVHVERSGDTARIRRR